MKTIKDRVTEKLKDLTPAQRAAGTVDALIEALDEVFAERDGVGTSPSTGPAKPKVTPEAK